MEHTKLLIFLTLNLEIYSCRNDKGTHKAINRFKEFGRKVSKNNTKQCFVLKCDIRKFFASIDHSILIKILNKNIQDKYAAFLLEEVIKSFETEKEKGLPLGNLTSQLLVNIYMNKFDQFVKHKLKIKYYIRYADDFVILSENKECLETTLLEIRKFLEINLKLELHSNKVFIKTLGSGVDFLGWVHFPNHRVLRTTTKRRMFKKLICNPNPLSKVSYLGLLKHGNTYKIQKTINPD